MLSPHFSFFSYITNRALPSSQRQMVELYGRVRDEWIATDFQGWLAPNRMYQGVPEAVRAAVQNEHTYIVTTKPVCVCVCAHVCV